jgi:hypothetical protein
MLTKTTIALATMLVAATSSMVLAQDFDPNLANRYPAYAAAGAYGYVPGNGTPTALTWSVGAKPQSAPAALRRGSAPVFMQRDVSLPTRQGGGDWFEINRSDRASSPYAGGN